VALQQTTRQLWASQGPFEPYTVHGVPQQNVPEDYIKAAVWKADIVPNRYYAQSSAPEESGIPAWYPVCYGRSTVVSDLDGLGFCPECLMAEVGKRLDYNEVRTTERWINTQGESACQALKGKGRKGLCKVFQPKRMRCRDSTKYAQRGCIGDVAEALQSIQQGPSDTRSQSYRLLAKLSSLIY
jgi:hypothetical protein